jgi:hypothetical protein
MARKYVTQISQTTSTNCAVSKSYTTFGIQKVHLPLNLQRQLNLLETLYSYQKRATPLKKRQQRGPKSKKPGKLKETEAPKFPC